MTGDLAVVDSAALEPMSADRREVAVTGFLSGARDLLVQALAATNAPAAVAQLKAELASVESATRQFNLSKEVRDDAAEMVRRAEYALGKAIRAGQERGEIRKVGDDCRTDLKDPVALRDSIASPSDFASKHELTNTHGGIYDLADATPPEFEAALTDAREEGNLSRANVIRKVRGVKSDGLTPVEKYRKIRDLAPTGMTSGQIAREIGGSEDYVRRVAKQDGIDIPADRVMRGTRRLDHNRFVNETVMALEGLASGLDVLDLSQVDRSQISDWSTSLTESLRALNRLAKQIKEMDQ